MSTTIKIAPDLEEITREGNVFKCEFNNMKIKWCIADDCSQMPAVTEKRLKKWLQAAIAMSGKLWQVPHILNNQLPFKSEVYVNDKIVEYPKE